MSSWKFISAVLFAPLLGLSWGSPQLKNRFLIRCEDPLINELSDNFDTCTYVLNQVACLTRPELKQCRSFDDQDPSNGKFCCDAAGKRLRELAPVAFEDRNEENCSDEECVCVKRNGRRVLDRLKSARSKTGIRYSVFYEHVMQYLGAKRDNPAASVSFPRRLELACFARKQ